MAVKRVPHASPSLDYIAAVLSSMDGNAALLDAEGKIVAVSEAWERFGRDNEASLSGVGVGTDYLQVCRGAAKDSETAKAVVDGLVSILNGTKPIFHCDYKCDSPDTLRWFRLTLTPWRAAGGRVLAVHREITHDKLATEVQSRILRSVRAII